jgi:hypothetical protein
MAEPETTHNESWVVIEMRCYSTATFAASVGKEKTCSPLW